MRQATMHIFVNYSPASRRLNHSLNGVFDGTEEPCSNCSFANSVPASRFPIFFQGIRMKLVMH